MAKFVIAEFFNEIPVTVEAFPSTWLSEDRKTCRWPPKCTLTLQKNFKSIPLSTWATCECRVLGHSDLFGEAHRKAKRAEDQSDLEEPKLKKRRRRVSPQNSNHSEADDEDEIIPSTPTPPQTVAATPIPTFQLVAHPVGEFNLVSAGSRPTDQSYETDQNEDTGHRTINMEQLMETMNFPEGNQTPVRPPGDNSDGFQRVALRQFRLILRNQKDIINLLNDLKTARSSANEDLEEDIDIGPLPDLPINAEEDLDALNTLLDLDDKRSQIMKYLASIGGNTVDKTVKEILKRLIGPDLRKKLSYTGKGNQKLSYSKYSNVNACVLCAARKNKKLKGKSSESDITEASVRQIVMDWFRFAPIPK